MVKLKGVQFSTGSLGHGLPIGCGLAKSRQDAGQGLHDLRFDGRRQNGEGSVWEAAARGAQQTRQPRCHH